MITQYLNNAGNTVLTTKPNLPFSKYFQKCLTHARLHSHACQLGPGIKHVKKYMQPPKTTCFMIHSPMSNFISFLALPTVSCISKHPEAKSLHSQDSPFTCLALPMLKKAPYQHQQHENKVISRL